MTAICPCCADSGAHFKTLGQKGCVRLLRCDVCGFVFADPEAWRNPYEQMDYYDPAKQPEVAYPITPNATDLDRLATLTRHVSGGRLVEFGGGLGATAIGAQRLGFKVTVIEDSAKAIAGGRQFHPELEWIHAAEIPADTAPASFDAASAFHVLEHIPNPKRLVESFAKILRPGGFLLIEVPNWGSYVRRLQGIRWHYVVDHHVNYFTRTTLARLIEPCGFTLADTVFRRTFCINEQQPWKEPLKRVAAMLGFGDILRCVFRRK